MGWAGWVGGERGPRRQRYPVVNRDRVGKRGSKLTDHPGKN